MSRVTVSPKFLASIALDARRRPQPAPGAKP